MFFFLFHGIKACTFDIFVNFYFHLLSTIYFVRSFIMFLSLPSILQFYYIITLHTINFINPFLLFKIKTNKDTLAQLNSKPKGYVTV